MCLAANMPLLEAGSKLNTVALVTMHMFFFVAPGLTKSRTYNNSVEDIPDNISNDTTLLDLSSNNLANADFGKLNGLQLESLTMQTCQLTSFPNLSAVGSTLTNLDLRYNQIRNISLSLLEVLSVLEYLDIADNLFTEFPNLSPVGDTLLILQFRVNPAVKSVDAEDVAQLTVLKDLDISFSHELVIHDLSPLADTLQRMIANGISININSSITNSFRNFPMLNSLMIQNTHLTTLPDLSTSCDKLQYLLLADNDIKSIDPLHFAKCTIMNTLALNLNELTALPNITAMGQTLQFLNLSANNISQLNQDFMLAQSALVSVNLQSNVLSEFPDVSNSGSTLTSLLLGSNQITYIEPGILRSLTQLTSLDLSDNQLSSFPDVSAPVLTSLNLARNKLRAVPTFHNFGESLVHLYLGENEISEVDSDAFAGLGNLQTLALNNTNLTAVPGIQDLPSLTVLTLANTSVTTLEPKISLHLGKLYTLDLRNTELVEVPSMCPESPFTLYLDNNLNLDLCDSKMAWLKQTFFTVTYTDQMCNATGKMWSATSFEELLDVHTPSVPGDVKGAYSFYIASYTADFLFLY